MSQWVTDKGKQWSDSGPIKMISLSLRVAKNKTHTRIKDLWKFYIFHTIEWTFFQEQVGVLAALLQLSLVIIFLLLCSLSSRHEFFTPSSIHILSSTVTNQFVTGKVVGTGSTLLLLARNKEQLEVKKESLCHIQIVIYCMSGNQGDGQRSKAWTSCGGYIIYFIVWILSSVWNNFLV